MDPTTGEIIQSMDAVNIYPAKHFVTPKDRLESAISAIGSELRERLDVLNGEGKLLEAQRLEQRTKYDRDAGPGRLLQRGRELCPSSGWARGRHSARVSD